jgi:adenylylsulfate kinase-like enzyme
MIINLTGQAGAGKTTLAKELLKLIPNSINIDGDELREMFSNKDYSENGRRNNITNAYNIATFLHHKGFNPLISLISPYQDLRDELKNRIDTLEFYIFTSSIRGRENYFVSNYQAPKERYIPIDTTNDSPERIADTIITCLETGFYNHLLISKNK